MVSEVSAVDIPLAPMAAHPLRLIREDDRERYLKRGAAWLAVALVHVLFVMAILTAGHIRQLARVQPHEVFFIIPPLNTKVEQLPKVEVTPAVRLSPLPQRLNRSRCRHQAADPAATQGDVMQAIGKELACGAGPYEHLTQAQRELCRRQPWRFKKNAHGVIVMDTSQPPPPRKSRRAVRIRNCISSRRPIPVSPPATRTANAFTKRSSAADARASCIPGLRRGGL